MMNLINTPHFLSRTEKARSWLDSEGHTEISSGFVEMEFRGRYVHGGGTSENSDNKGIFVLYRWPTWKTSSRRDQQMGGCEFSFCRCQSILLQPRLVFFQQPHQQSDDVVNMKDKIFLILATWTSSPSTWERKVWHQFQGCVTLQQSQPPPGGSFLLNNYIYGRCSNSSLQKMFFYG